MAVDKRVAEAVDFTANTACKFKRGLVDSAQTVVMMYSQLVRTARDARTQEGITMLLIPMDSPGLTVRPIRTIDGIHNVNEVFHGDNRSGAL